MRPSTIGILKPVLRPLSWAPAPTKLWIAVFTIWTLSLSGWVGVPGVYQAMRLKSLLNSKQAQIQQVQADLKRLQQEATELEKNKITQQREIRKTLGYAAPDEIIFDFTQEGQF